MSFSEFDAWFADYLGQSPFEVQRLLGDKTAVRFLIAWSLFETSCFGGFAKERDLEVVSKHITEVQRLDVGPLVPILEGFHARYQDKKLLANLMHDHTRPDLRSLLERPVHSLSNWEKVFFLVAVVYRYRNNIFHGTKGVESWLQFKPQIELCTQVMQALVQQTSTAERRRVEDRDHNSVSACKGQH